MIKINCIFMLIISIYIQNSHAKDYFNPLFLGGDVASIDDLLYLNMGNKLYPGNYYLYLYLGDKFIGDINLKFEKKNNDVEPCFTKDILLKIPLNNKVKNEILNSSDKNQECIMINYFIENFNYDIDLTKLVVRLSVPQVYLLEENSSLANEEDWDDGISAFLMNYNFTGSYSKNKNYHDYSSYYINLNNRINVGSWRLKSNTYINTNKLGDKVNNEIKTSNISLSRNINKLKSTLSIGQSILGASLFETNSYIGVTLETANELLADNDKGYAPAIRGIATSKSKLTIKQNKNIVYQAYINPGAYDINNLNSVGNSGIYEVELTTADGTISKYTVPYSSLPNLLRKGRFNYAITLGRLDGNLNTKDKFIQNIFSIGLPYESTIFWGQQIAKDYFASGLGVGKNLGQFGAFSIDSIYSHSKINNDNLHGQSYRILYLKSFNNLGANIQLTGYRYSTYNFYSLNEAIYQNSHNGIDNYLGRKKDSFQVNLSQSLSDYGQFYIWGNLNSYWGSNKKSRNIQLGWNKTIKSLNNLTLNLNYNQNKSDFINDNAFFMSISIPINNGYDYMYLSNSAVINKSSYNNLTNLYGDLLDGKLNYSLYKTINKDRDSNTSNANVSYKANKININIGTIYSPQSKQIDYGLSGGVLFHEGGVSLVREATDTAILVEAKGAEGTKINRSGENIFIDKNGYALIPYASPYHYNDVELDPSTFANGFDIHNRVLKVSPTRGAISKVKFDVIKGFNYLVSVSHKGKPIKFGTLISNDQNNSISIADEDGVVYLTGVKNKSIFTVKLSNQSSCSFSIHYDSETIMESINKLNVNCL